MSEFSPEVSYDAEEVVTQGILDSVREQYGVIEQRFGPLPQLNRLKPRHAVGVYVCHVVGERLPTLVVKPSLIEQAYSGCKIKSARFTEIFRQKGHVGLSVTKAYKDFRHLDDNTDHLFIPFNRYDATSLISYGVTSQIDGYPLEIVADIESACSSPDISNQNIFNVMAMAMNAILGAVKNT